jgi:hypothetical protein
MNRGYVEAGGDSEVNMPGPREWGIQDFGLEKCIVESSTRNRGDIRWIHRIGNVQRAKLQPRISLAIESHHASRDQ